MRAVPLALAAALLLAAAPEARARGVKIPRKLVRKAFCSPSPPVDQGPASLVKHFSKKRNKVTLKRGKDRHWRCLLAAFFRRRSVPGPVTLWFYDAADKAAIKAREPVHVVSIDASPARVFVRKLDLDPDIGFNKNRTYLVWVGQIINGREKVYARGTLVLEP